MNIYIYIYKLGFDTDIVKPDYCSLDFHELTTRCTYNSIALFPFDLHEPYLVQILDKWQSLIMSKYNKSWS
jgi:hypothetical protein